MCWRSLVDKHQLVPLIEGSYAPQDALLLRNGLQATLRIGKKLPEGWAKVVVGVWGRDPIVFAAAVAQPAPAAARTFRGLFIPPLEKGAETLTIRHRF